MSFHIEVELGGWAVEHDYPQELREMGLAMRLADSFEQAYRQSTHLNNRRENERLV